jgi:hypothetical protein
VATKVFREGAWGCNFVKLWRESEQGLTIEHWNREEVAFLVNLAV